MKLVFYLLRQTTQLPNDCRGWTFDARGRERKYFMGAAKAGRVEEVECKFHICIWGCGDLSYHSLLSLSLHTIFIELDKEAT